MVTFGLNTDTLTGPGECYQDCGCDVSSYCCWVFCSMFVVRTARAKLREQAMKNMRDKDQGKQGGLFGK